MQFTNIARDVGEDAARGRLYLPTSWLHEAGIDPARWLDAPSFTPELGSVVRRVLEAARRLYERAESGIGRLPVRVRSAIWGARLIYADIGRVIAERRYDSITRRAVTSPVRKAWLLATAIGTSLGRPRRGEHRALPEARFLVELAAPGRGHATAPPRSALANPIAPSSISQETS
jgi:phytoene synthase